MSTNPLDLNYIIMTTTRGHYNRHDIVEEVYWDFFNYSRALVNFKARYCNIKSSPESGQYLPILQNFFSTNNFVVNTTAGAWKHNCPSHQSGYLSDLSSIMNRHDVNRCQYTMITEDDFKIRSFDINFQYWAEIAVEILRNNHECVQVRIPRFVNEFERINKLKEKHNIDGKAERVNKDYFMANDWSNNVYFCRTRDLRNALLLMQRHPDAFPVHSEHGLGRAMKYWSNIELPFAILNPERIRCFHCGTPQGQEDNLTEALTSD